MDPPRRSGFQLRSGDPFAAPEDQRELVRQVRGRLAAPVTLWTAGSGETRQGLTISSVLIAEGAPGEVIGLIGSLSDLRDAIEASGYFLIHVLEEQDRRLADEFAGVYPVDPFEQRATAPTRWGPRLVLARTWMGCRLTSTAAAGYATLVRGEIEAAELVEGGRPLLHLRGHYRTLGEGS